MKDLYKTFYQRFYIIWSQDLKGISEISTSPTSFPLPTLLSLKIKSHYTAQGSLKTTVLLPLFLEQHCTGIHITAASFQTFSPFKMDWLQSWLFLVFCYNSGKLADTNTHSGKVLEDLSFSLDSHLWPVLFCLLTHLKLNFHGRAQLSSQLCIVSLHPRPAMLR